MNEAAPGDNQHPDEAPFGQQIDPRLIDEERQADRQGTETWHGEAAYGHLHDLHQAQAGLTEGVADSDTRPQHPSRRIPDATRDIGRRHIANIRRTQSFEDPATKAEEARRKAQQEELLRRARAHKEENEASTQA